MVKRVEVEKALKITRHTIMRLCKDLKIKEYKLENYIYLEENDVDRMKHHIEKYEPYLINRKNNKHSSNVALKEKLEHLEQAYLEDTGNNDILREIHNTRLKLKQRTGSSNIFCVSVDDRGGIK